MKKLRLILVLVLPLLLAGCQSTLAPGGAYAPVTITNGVTNQTVLPDMAFYTTDAAFWLAAATLDTAFTFERDNRAALWQLSPKIKQTLDSIRPDAWAAVKTYKTARDAYRKNPTPTGLSLLNTILSKIQQFNATASAVVTTTNP